MKPIPARERLIVALDFPDVATAAAMVDRLGASVAFYKIGLQLIYAGGLDFARRLAGSGKRVFLDAKLLDIDNTVAGAIGSIAAAEVDCVTVHAYPAAMRAAVAARGDAALRILGVTVLTSMNDDDLKEAGYSRTAAEVVALRAAAAKAAGVDGVVASPEEAAAVRRIVGPDVAIVTPGIRPADASRDDQKRVATPATAIRDGADYLVVGRPVAAASDPRRAAEAIVGEIEAALAEEEA